MWLFPSVAALVALVFATLLGRQYSQKRRPYQLVWVIALAMYAVASLALALGAAGEWTRGGFQVYWALGAVLNVPFLAAGEVLLLFRRGWVLWACVIALVFVSAYTTAVLRDSTMSTQALSEQLPSGKEVFGDGTPAHRLAQLVSYPAYFLLLAGTLWSAWRMRGRPELKDRFVGTLLIAVGATIVAGGAAFAAYGVLAGFTATLAAGISLMFWGFLRASRHAVAVAPATAQPAPG
jgi:hypothetical protein